MGIEVSNLSYAYAKGAPVLREVSFEIESGHFVCLLGPNGVGKSTLFKCMLGLLTGFSGSIRIDGADIRTLTPRQLARKVAYIPQSTAPAFNYSVADVVLMGTTSLVMGFSAPGKKEMAYVESALEQINIGYLRDRMFLNISGGERQLVLIARALAQQARILFMDEPTANLDYGNQVRVLERVRQLSREGYTVIQSTHNPDQAFMYADEVMAVMDGQIEAYGSPAKIMDSELIRKLYRVNVSVESLRGGEVRMCVPTSVLKEKQAG